VLGIGPAEILILLLLIGGLAGFVIWLWLLIDAVKTPASTWDAAGQNQLLHILLMVCLGIIGSLIYYFVARPALKAVAP